MKEQEMKETQSKYEKANKGYDFNWQVYRV